MNPFQKKTAIRIAAVSVILASLASPISWFVARESAENGIVSLAIEESGRLAQHYDAINLVGPEAKDHAVMATKTISGGLFDIAEIYDRNGHKLAASLSKEGEKAALLLPEHGIPNYKSASYENVKVAGERWVLRVFVPLRVSSTDLNAPVAYFGDCDRLFRDNPITSVSHL